MSGRPLLAAGAAAALALLAAAAAPTPAVAAGSLDADDRNSFVYRPPDKPPKGARTHYVEGPPEWLLDHIVADLRRLGLTTEARDTAQHRLVMKYSGDPREFIDCGVVEMLVDGKRSRPPKQYSANRPETRTYRVGGGHRVGLMREIRLDARLAIEAEPQGKRSRVVAEAVYVLTKTVSRVYKGGETGEVLDHEVMSLTSGEIGRFKKGTSCVATGKLEDLPTLPYRKAAKEGEN